MISYRAKVDPETLSKGILDDILNRLDDYINADPLSSLLKRNQLISPYSKPSNSTFRVMSYNVLADSLTQMEEVASRPSYELKYLNWNYRAKLLFSEIKTYNPDILCLQEVDHHNGSFKECFENDYYIYYRKRANGKIDGCMTLVKKTKFIVIEAHYVEFFVSAEDPLLNKDNICLILVVQSLHDGSVLIVANTHLLFNHNRGEIKIAQAYLALKACSALAETYKKQDVNIIYAGDFNSTPQSGIYEFLRKGEFDFREIRSNVLSGQKLGAFENTKWFKTLQEFLVSNVNRYRFNFKVQENNMDFLSSWLFYLKKIKVVVKSPNENGEIQKIDFEVSEMGEEFDPSKDENWRLYNDFYMMSAYGNFQKFYYGLKFQKHPSEVKYPHYSTFEPLYTHRTGQSLLTVDYIWYCSRYSHQGKKLKISSLFELPRIEDGLKVHVFPNRIYPTDHLSLVVDFEMS